LIDSTVKEKKSHLSTVFVTNLNFRLDCHSNHVSDGHVDHLENGNEARVGCAFISQRTEQIQSIPDDFGRLQRMQKSDKFSYIYFAYYSLSSSSSSSLLLLLLFYSYVIIITFIIIIISIIRGLYANKLVSATLLLCAL